MSTTTVGVEFRAYNRSQTGIASFTRSLQRLQRTALGVAGAYVSGRGVVGAARSVVDATVKQERATTRLHTLMGNVPGTTDKAIASTVKYTEALQRATTIGDDVGQMGASQLATFQLQSTTIEKLLPSLYDLATAVYGVNVSQEQMVTVSNLMGKAMQGQVGALTRYGVTVTEAQAQTLKFGTEQQKTAAMVELLGANFGGLAETMAHTTEGQMQQLQNTWGDTKELLGSALLPAINEAATTTRGWLTDNQAHIKRWASDFVEGIGIVIQAIGRLNTANKPFREKFGRLSKADQASVQRAYLSHTGQNMGYQDIPIASPTGAVLGTKRGFIDPENTAYANAVVDKYLQARGATDPMQDLKNRVDRLDTTVAGHSGAGGDGASATDEIAKTVDIFQATARMYDQIDSRSAESYNVRLAYLMKQRRDYEEMGLAADAIDTWYDDRYARHMEGRLKATGSFFDGFRAGLSEMERELPTIGDLGANVGQQLRDGMVGSVTDAVFETRKLNDALNETGRAAAKLAFQWAMTQTVTRGMSWLSGASSATSHSAGATTANARGNVFGPSGLRRFDRGGVVSQPTYFDYAGGTGLMGEAGDEGVFPLERDRSSGKLGVIGRTPPVNVQVINNGAAKSAQTTAPQYDGHQWVIGVILDDLDHGGPLSERMR